ncbi:hypothetical protein [Parasitella parasitica]|uniref:Uncharacterized protein n=1 Tax=Parasitella parasitica TaxID=35722 RepID=A0A0B7NQV3_9FUNG|nr:hypothetical protein [Parasitella parasitica]
MSEQSLNLNCHIQGAITQSEAARRYGQHLLTVRSILDAWYVEGRMEKKQRGGRRKEALKFEDVHAAYITELLDEDCTKTLDMIKEELESKFPDLAEKNVSTSGLWRFMIERIGFTLKRTKAVEERRNTSETIQQRYEYVVQRLPKRGLTQNINASSSVPLPQSPSQYLNTLRRKGTKRRRQNRVAEPSIEENGSTLPLASDLLQTGKVTNEVFEDGQLRDELLERAVLTSANVKRVGLHNEQSLDDPHSNRPRPHGKLVDALLRSLEYEEEKHKRENYVDRGVGTVADGYSTTAKMKLVEH